MASPGGRSEDPSTMRRDPVFVGSTFMRSGAVPPRRKRFSPSSAGITAGRGGTGFVGEPEATWPVWQPIATARAEIDRHARFIFTSDRRWWLANAQVQLRQGK